MNQEEAMLLGTMLGDGCLCRCRTRHGIRNYVVVSGHIKDDNEFLTKLIKPTMFKLFNKTARERRQPDHGKLDIIIQSKELLNYMSNEWGLPIGKCRNRKIKEEFLKHSILMKSIVGGFFATDGSLVITDNNGIIYPRIEFQNISKTLLEQVQHFLSKKVGLKGGGLYKMIREHSIVYRLQYNGKENLLKFSREIGFVNPKNKRKFNGFIDNSRGSLAWLEHRKSLYNAHKLMSFDEKMIK